MPTITPELREAFEKQFGTFNTAGRQAFTHEHVLSFIAEREALARAEELSKVARSLKEIVNEKDMPTEWVKSELEAYIDILDRLTQTSNTDL